MANIVLSKVSVKGPEYDIEAFLRSVKSPEMPFDFDVIKPMPKCLRKVASGTTGVAHAVIWFISNRLTNMSHLGEAEKVIKSEDAFASVSGVPEQLQHFINAGCYPDLDALYELGKKYVENYAHFGYATWYGWRCANWGCKTKALDALIERPSPTKCRIYITTKWVSPLPLFRTLAALFPALKFFGVWGETENPGCNCGCWIARDGKVRKVKAYPYNVAVANSYYTDDD